MAAALQRDRYGQSTAPDWAAMAAGTWGASSWKSAAREYHGARQRSGGKPPQSPDPQLLALLDPAISLGRYFPRLTLIKQQIAAGFRLTLRIEFSAPKLLLANNLDELESSCSPKLIAQAGA